ncbi:hypothetical protein TNCV_4960301 [Trichonephila clavipes]|uniref:Uncharacterized protein n=1 Tax=Trichonephila clavipes TaxID=2585209 RepID=A0A8X6SLC1_TRICX|nr:hypothetical protein TNCV_4960301 [Trichonephila clavipes]
MVRLRAWQQEEKYETKHMVANSVPTTRAKSGLPICHVQIIKTSPNLTSLSPNFLTTPSRGLSAPTDLKPSIPYTGLIFSCIRTQTRDTTMAAMSS